VEVDHEAKSVSKDVIAVVVNEGRERARIPLDNLRPRRRFVAIIFNHLNCPLGAKLLHLRRQKQFPHCSGSRLQLPFREQLSSHFLPTIIVSQRLLTWS
jgi:hypothetical protein